MFALTYFMCCLLLAVEKGTNIQITCPLLRRDVCGAEKCQ